MQQDTYEAIKAEWGKITSGEQRALIYRYIQGDGSGLRGSWMEFLQNQFGLPYQQTFGKKRPAPQQSSM